jgi:transcriptional regulatory protein RtcR
MDSELAFALKIYPISVMKKQIVIGMLGTTLDGGLAAERWERWRPSVDLCRHEDLVVDRFEVLYQEKFERLAAVVRGDITAVSPETEIRLHRVEFKDPWDFEEVYGALHDFARAYRFDVDREDYLVHMTTGTHVAQICLFLLAEARYIPGRLIQTSPPPARRARSEPGTFTIIDLDLSKYDRLASRFRQEQRAGLSFLKAGIDTRNRAFNRLIERIEQVAIASKAPLLLTGPTGAGKSQLARRIYELKKSRQQVEGRFVEVNCATVRGDAAMSALFGHVKGAFTGAVRDRPGLLRAADQGILFLDEIGELGPDEQAMLLRALEDKVFLPVGADREVRSNFQLIAGTNQDLAARVVAGRFREDLLARINLWTFRLPSLRERPEDVEPNLDYELTECAQRTGRQVTLSREARQAFLRFATSPEARWPGNFRDFNAAVERMATFAAGGRITAEIVGEEIARLKEAWTEATGTGPVTAIDRVLDAETLRRLDHFDRVQLAEVLRVCTRSATLSDAGRKLFAVSRDRRSRHNDADRLRKYLARFGLRWQDIPSGR